MDNACVFALTLLFAAIICLSGSGTSSIAAEHRTSAEFAGGVHGTKHFGGGGRGAVPDRFVRRSFAKPSLQYLWSGAHSPTVIGGPYRPNKHIAAWGQSLNGARSAAAVGGTVRIRGRY
jgi:kynureninase